MTVEEWLGKDNQLGIDIWNKKYRNNDESFNEWIGRVSAGDDRLKRFILDKKIMLGGRTMANRGTENNASYFNCYSHGYCEDDYYDLMHTAMDIGLTFKSQGGQGLSMSKVRPKGTPIGKEYTSDGIIPFMKIFNEVTSGTSQGGSRKGALMISLDAWHKEALDFIRIKSKEGEIEKANLSLEIDDEFMNIVRDYYCNGSKRKIVHKTVDYSGHTIEYDVDPVRVFDALVDNCYDWADPAALFVNRFRNYNLLQYDDDYQIETSNPCGEQPLPKHGACCLASINLSEFVVDPYTGNAKFDFASFIDAVKCGVDTLDVLIDENYYKHPLAEQAEMSYNYRNIGLGVFGYATMLMKLGMRYGSESAITFTDFIFNLMFKTAVKESSSRALQLGSYPAYKDCVWDSEIIKNHFKPDEISQLKQAGLRNCSLISIAPTGSIATMCNESGGCEPEFAIKYTRRTVGMTDGDDTYYDVYCKAAREYMEKCETNMLPDYFVGANQIDCHDRIATQAVMQNHVDTAISSTVNLPNSITKRDIVTLYVDAWESGLKGVTIFRDGCMRMPILSTTSNKNSEKEIKQGTSLPRGFIIDTSDDYIGRKRKIISGCGSLHCEAYFDPLDGSLMEVFFNKGSTGGCERNLQALSRMISLSARGGIDVHTICDQLKSVGGCTSYCVRSATKHDTSNGTSCASAIANALLDMWNETQKEIVDDSEEVNTPESIVTAVDKCPECGAELIHNGGCVECKSCGYSKCG